MDNYIKNPKYKSILAFFCAFGWSLAYPLIKIGYEQFSIPSSDLGGKIIFAGVRFFFALIPVLLFCRTKKLNLAMQKRTDISWLLLLAVLMVACGIWLVNRAPHNRKQKPVTKE